RGTQTETRMTTARDGRPDWPHVPSAAHRAGRRLSARDQIQPLQKKPRDSHALAPHIPQPVMHQHCPRRRLTVDIVAIADERQRNDNKISTIVRPWVEKLLPEVNWIRQK